MKNELVLNRLSELVYKGETNMSESYFERFQKIKLGLAPREAVAKSKKPIKKVSDKKKLEMGADRGDNALDKWFEERRKEMKGICVLCGGSSCKSNDDEYRRSIAHLLPKRSNMFPSVALHPDNWIELCFYGNSCHTNFDNNIITLELILDSVEGKIVIEKFKKIYPFIAEKEKRHIPEILLNQIKEK